MKLCPYCKSELSKDEKEDVWCSECQRTIDLESAADSNGFQGIYSSLSRKHSNSLIAALIEASPEKLKPSLTLSKIFAFAISALIYLITFSLPIFGVWLLYIGLTNFFAFIGGVVCLLTVWMLRPKLPKVPKNVVSKSEFPILYKFIEEIALEIGAKSVDGIVITGDLNASFGRYGLSNRRILSIGLPLWEILSIEEKKALISHELSHEINGDPLRSLFIGNALILLIGWYSILRPQNIWEPENGLLGLLLIPVNIFLLIVSGIVLLFVHLLSHLIFIDSQKAEYFADYSATKACGTEAMTALLEKCLISGKKFQHTLHKISMGKVEKDFFDEFRREIFSMSEDERNKIKKVEKLTQSRLDSTHPPTLFRIRFLQHHFEIGKEVGLSKSEINCLENETFKVRREIQEKLTENYHSFLYY